MWVGLEFGSKYEGLVAAAAFEAVRARIFLTAQQLSGVVIVDDGDDAADVFFVLLCRSRTGYQLALFRQQQRVRRRVELAIV